MFAPYISDEAGDLKYCSYCMCFELAPVDDAGNRLDSHCTNYAALVHLCHVGMGETPIN